MEVVLNKLGNQPDLKHVEGLFDAIQKAKHCLQLPPAQCHSHERRRKCIDCFALALGASGRPKFAAIAFEGVQLLLRDNESLGSEVQSPEGQSRAEQLVSLFAQIPAWREAPPTQCQALTSMVQLVSSTEVPLRLGDVLNAIEVCKRTFDSAVGDSSAVRPAARAALTQMLNSYVQNRLAVAESGDSTEIGALMDVTALLGELIARMGTAIGDTADAEKSAQEGRVSKLASQPLLLPLDAMFSVLSALEPASLLRHCPLLNLLKGELLPVVICHLHGSAKCAGGTESGGGGAVRRIGSIVGTLKRAGRSSTSVDSPHIPVAAMALEWAESARSFYQVVEQLLRLFSPLALSTGARSPAQPSSSELLPLLDELWRSALLAPAVPKRAEALRLAKRLFANRALFCVLLQLNTAIGTDAFWLLLVECLEECCTGAAAEPRLAVDALRTLSALLSAISQLLGETDLSAEFPSTFFASLAQKHAKNGMTEEEEGTGNGKAKPRNVGRTQTTTPLDTMAHSFADAFVRELPKWRELGSAQALDEAMQEFATRMCHQLNETVMEQNGQRRKGADLSGASTPEDSEEESEEQKSVMGETPTERMEAMEVYLTVNELLRQNHRSGGSEEGARREELTPAEQSSLPPFVPRRALFERIQLFLQDHSASLQTFCPLQLLHITRTDPLSLPPDVSDISIDRTEHQRLLLARCVRTLLHNCWSSLQRMLTHFPFRREKGGTNSFEEEGKYVTVVEALAVLVPLAAQLGLVAELRWTMEYIGEQICTLEELREAVKRSAKKAATDDPKPARRFCGRPEMLAQQVVMENATIALCIAPDSAKYVIRCAQFLWELERWHFKLAKSTIDAIYEPPALPVPPSASGQHSPIGQLIGPSWPGATELSSTELARLMDQFLVLIDQLFSDSPTVLPLDAFCALLGAMAAANEDNLHYSGGLAPTETSAQLLQRMCILLSGTAHSPLVHQASAWSKAREHLVQCASVPSLPPEISRRAIDGIHEALNALLRREWAQGEQHKVVHGWNGLLFEVFVQILGDAQCSTETRQHIAQVLVSFVEQSADLVCTGWRPLFGAAKLIIQPNGDNASDSATGDASGSIVVELFQKFLAIQKPAILLSVFCHFGDALVQLSAQNAVLFDRLHSLLQSSQHLLLDCLFSASVPSPVLPVGLVESADAELDELWAELAGGHRGAGEESADYLHLLVDLRTVLVEQMPVEGAEEWLAEGAGSKNAEQFFPNDANPPWHHLSAAPCSRVVASHAFKLALQLTSVVLAVDTCTARDTSHQAVLALNLADFVQATSAQIGADFASFVLCSAVLPHFKLTVASQLTASGARSLKQFIGIVCSHRAVVDLLTGKSIARGWLMQLLSRLLDLAVRCIAKGGALSLAGCALVRRLFALCADSDQHCAAQMRALCANGIWLATRYSLFPVRMLIAQFFANSTDFSGDLGQMRVSYRLGLSPAEVEERVDNVHQLANQVFQLEEQCAILKKEGGPNEKNGHGTERRESTGGAHFPSKFAYLFIFEGSAATAAQSAENAQKLSMGLDELVDSLLCQQLLVQLVSEELGRKANTAPSSSLAVHVPLLCTLHATLVICEQLEQRPGLKSLIQKLTGLSRSANLWKLAVPTLNALLRWNLQQAVKVGDDGGEETLARHVKRIGQLLRGIGGGEVRQLDNVGKNGNNKGAAVVPPRANPFISSQLSVDASKQREAQSEEDAEAQSFAVEKLLHHFTADLCAEPPKGKRLRELLAAELRATVQEWKLEGSGGRVLEEAVGKLEEQYSRQKMDRTIRFIRNKDHVLSILCPHREIY